MANNYNINAMRPALIAARNSGNRRAISEAAATSAGVTSVYYKVYQEDVKKLYEATAAYCRAKNNPRTDDSELNQLHEALRQSWQHFTECAEATEFSKELRVSDHDISNLVGFCQGFMDDSNNTEFDKKFQAKKVWCMMPIAKFQRWLETDLGIRIAGVEVLSDEERDFLTAENNFLHIISAGNAAIKESEDMKRKLASQIEKAKSDEMKEYLAESVKEFDEKIAKAKAAIESAQDSLDELRAGTIEVELPPDVADAESAADAMEQTEEPEAAPEAAPVEPVQKPSKKSGKKGA